MHAYTMHGYEQPKYGLRNIFQGQPKTEQMELMPRVLVVCDSPVLGLRMSVLICEDFCQQTPGLEAIRNLRCTLDHVAGHGRRSRLEFGFLPN